MRRFQRIPVLLFAAGLCVSTAREGAGDVAKWTGRNGDSFEGELFAAYGAQAWFLNQKGQSLRVPIGALIEEDVRRVVVWTTEWDARRRDRPLMRDATSPLSRFFVENLVRPEAKKAVRWDPSERREPEFYALYFSAAWCGPCRRFTPGFATVYHGLKRAGFENFEVIFVSSDESTADMLRYIEEDKMPWPAVRHAKAGAPEVRRFAGRGIPNLVVVTRDGNVLLHSYSGERYLGPGKVLEDFQRILVASNRPDRPPIGK